MALNCQNADDVMTAINSHNVKMVNFRFIDVPGITQNFTIPASAFEPDMFEEGLGFDGSSVRGFQSIDQSDMLVMPAPTTAFIDPFYEDTTLVLICDIKDPISGEFYTRDPRHIAIKAERYLKSTGIADTAYIGPEAEFFVFDDVRYGQSVNEGFYRVDSEEGNWNTGMRGWEGAGSAANLGYKARPKGGYFPVPPTDKLQDLRSHMVLLMEETGLTVEAHHHEVGTGGQCEIDLKYDSLLRMADKMTIYKYIVKNVAWKAGKTATFMPKPLFEDNGSGMHCHQSLWKDGKPLFYSDNGNYAMLSDIARWYVGGLLKHAPSVLAFAAPTTNSYRRLVPGYEAPIFLVMSQRNRSAMIRIPTYSPSPAARRIEFRAPDPSANPYLAFSAMLMGLDGIENKIEPPEPMDLDFYELGPEEAAKIQSAPGSLRAVVDALEEDHDFLMRGDVFTSDFLETYVDYKRTEEADPIRLRPHPYEFFLYYDV